MAKILVVEDDTASRTGLVKILQNAGHEAFGAATFDEGRRLLTETHFDLLIVDLRLGGFNGLQLIVTRPMPAIVMSTVPGSSTCGAITTIVSGSISVTCGLRIVPKNTV